MLLLLYLLVSASRLHLIMAEVFGAVAAAVSLAHLTKKATKSLRELQTAADDAPKEIEDTVSQLERISTICEIVRRHYEGVNLPQPSGILDVLKSLQDCRAAVAELESALAFDHPKSRLSRVKRLVVASRKQEELRRLAQDVHRTRTGLDTIVSAELL